MEKHRSRPSPPRFVVVRGRPVVMHALPFTGLPVALLTLFGGAALGAGLLLRRVTRPD